MQINLEKLLEADSRNGFTARPLFLIDTSDPNEQHVTSTDMSAQGVVRTSILHKWKTDN